MRIENYFDLGGRLGFSGLFFACGSFGIVDGNIEYGVAEEGEKTIYRYRGKGIELQAVFETVGNVCIRRDSIKNISGQEIEINALVSRFCLDGNAYEIYTQYNGWQHESKGTWHPLVTQVSAVSQGIRTCDGAAPMMGLHNLYTGKNTVFHLIPNAQWQMTAKKFPRNDREIVVVETGFYDRGLRLRVAAGECIELPAVVFFSAESKTDLDAYKLHEWFNGNYPRKTLPILYNSWLYCFDQLNIDALMKQADCAADMGFEGFMIDAGWFGNGESWSAAVGDWEENTVSGPCGRLIELSERVREKGMIFGLWFEPERADPRSDAVAAHPEFYIDGIFLDFANPAAVDHITEILTACIEKYQIGWLKFDFNASIPIDPSGNAFYRYMQGQKDFILRLRERYPDLYITNCASGGYRMELGQGMLFDDFWLSDNQGPYEGIRIVKDTLKRMPSALIQRWNVQKYCEDFLVYPDKKTGRMIHCNNATWDFLIGVQDSFSGAFMLGGPMGFSCDLDVPPAYKALWRGWIEEYKKERIFYRNATTHILVDSEEITAIQYATPDLSRCILQLFTKTTYARELILYPFLKEQLLYQIGNERRQGAEILENGIFIKDLKCNDCQIIELIAKSTEVNHEDHDL